MATRQKRMSARRHQTKIRLAKAKAAEANWRKDRAHKLSAAIVAKASVIAFEALTRDSRMASFKFAGASVLSFSPFFDAGF